MSQEQSPTDSQVPQQSPPPAQPQPVVITQVKRQCIRCGYQGYMPKKWDSWVLPVAIIVGIFTCGLGLLILFVPKKYRCPQCDTAFE